MAVIDGFLHAMTSISEVDLMGIVVSECVVGDLVPGHTCLAARLRPAYNQSSSHVAQKSRK